MESILLLERVSPIEWDNVVLYGQYILTGSSFAAAVPQKKALYRVGMPIAEHPAQIPAGVIHALGSTLGD